MKLDQFADEGIARRYEYPDRTVIVADFGPAADPSVDVVDDTVIVITRDGQRELELPAGDVRAFNRNGIVTVEVRQ